MRAIQAHQNLEKKSRDREEARLKGKRTGCKSDCEKSVESFLPCAEEGMLRLSQLMDKCPSQITLFDHER